jgi:hypothetical protein
MAPFPAFSTPEKSCPLDEISLTTDVAHLKVAQAYTLVRQLRSLVFSHHPALSNDHICFLHQTMPVLVENPVTTLSSAKYVLLHANELLHVVCLLLP